MNVPTSFEQKCILPDWYQSFGIRKAGKVNKI